MPISAFSETSNSQRASQRAKMSLKSGPMPAISWRS
jgi:hypothetical protein